MTTDNTSLYESPSCVDCGLCGCSDGSKRYPAFCVTKGLTDEQIAELPNAYFADDDTKNAMDAASGSARDAYNDCLTRLEEIMDFCHRAGYTKIGIAACATFQSEARMCAKILRLHGYEVFGVCCKVGAVSRHAMDPREPETGYGCISCNPVLQADLLNNASTDVNIIMGLCVGHDALFSRYADALNITLLTKDRALYNNPAVVFDACTKSSPYCRVLTRNEKLAAVEK